MGVIEELLRGIDLSTLPQMVVWVLFVYFVVVRDVDARLDGLSSYIKKFLALQQRRARANETLADKIEELCQCLKSPLGS